MFDVAESVMDNAVIKVVGIGGGGGNAVEHMLEHGIDGVEFICANTDAQALKNSSSRTVIQIGNELTKGLGAGANPEVGKRAAQEDRMRIQETLQGADMVFITAGMGGGTGTGAAPVIAEIAKDMGILTVAVVTKPFPFEGRRRMQIAETGITELAENVDSLITIPNSKLLSVLGKNISLLDAFKAANSVLQGAVQGISELITRPGLINVDFADVRTVMAAMGVAMMGTAMATGENRAREAAEAAVASPLLEDINLEGARGVLVNITAGMDMSIGEFEEVGEVIKSFTSDQATVIVGTVIDPEMTDELRVTIVVTGLEESAHAKRPMQAEAQSSNGQYKRATGSQYATRQSGSSQSVGGSKRAAPKGPVSSSSKDGESEYLDIPTFLRRQAD
ncbi:cell division protein FtsZ [Thiotrichales bacterium 19S11-10]|nr:cell division protein FtsZ [Thiotrichales bacterium 19S11-10]